MNLLLLFLALLCVLAISLCIVLYLRLRARKGLPEAASEQFSTFSASSDASSDPLQMTAIDQYLYDRCCRYMMERRPFLVESFSLQDLANAVFTNRAYLSKTINRFSGRNFRQYVNYYRVMYAMELFRSNMSLRITDLAQLSGFHTVTSFFQSFKQVMGEPPSHWCSRLRKKYLKKLKQ